MDDWPKPELLYALTPFEVLAGLRTPADAADLLRALAVDQLGPLAGELSAATSEQAMADALASVLEWPEPSRAGLVADVVVACSKLAAVLVLRLLVLRLLVLRSAATRTRAPRRCGSPRITRMTSG